MLPPLGLLVGILDKASLKMAEKAELRVKTQEKLTPFATTEFEEQRNKSRS